jgi:hypothetical protein
MTTAVKKSKKASKRAKGKGKVAKPEAVAATETTLAERERKHYQEIQELGAECEKLEADFKDKKATASAAKSAWESAVSVLQATIRRGPDPQLQLPLGDVTGQLPKTKPASDIMATPIGKALTLTKKLAELLEEAGIRTVDDFIKLQAGAGLRSIRGIGGAKADALENDLLDWISGERIFRRGETALPLSEAAATATDVVDQDDEDGDS